MMKFGLSTRLYLFGGPEELRPAEGLSKLQRRQLAALEVTHEYSKPCMGMHKAGCSGETRLVLLFDQLITSWKAL